MVIELAIPYPATRQGAVQPTRTHVHCTHTPSIYLSRGRDKRTLVLTCNTLTLRKRVPDINLTFVSQAVAFSKIWNLSAGHLRNGHLQGKLAAWALFAMLVVTGRRAELFFCKQWTTDKGWRRRPGKYGALGGIVTKAPVTTTVNIGCRISAPTYLSM